MVKFNITNKTTAWNQTHESAGRGDHHVEMIVIHGMALTDPTLIPALWNERAASAHYGIKNDHIELYVAPENTAWHAGVWNINQRSIGIEHLNSTGAPTWDFSNATLSTSINFVATLVQQYHLTVNDIHMHREFSITECPQSLAIPSHWANYLERITEITGDKLIITPKLTPNGTLAPDVIKAMQKVLGQPQDGHINSQPRRDQPLFNGNDQGLEFVPDQQATGSTTIRELQKRLNLSIDGFWGKSTTMALQQRYGIAEPDGIIVPNARVIALLQGQLNTGLEDFSRML